MERAWILVKETVVFRDRRVRTYEWEGPPTATTTVRLGREWETLRREAPWPLKVVGEDDFASGRLIIARTDGANRLSWLYHTAKAWLTQRMALTKARIIITLAVWSLAYVPEGCSPQWSDIKKPHWLKRLTGGECR